MRFEQGSVMGSDRVTKHPKNHKYYIYGERGGIQTNAQRCRTLYHRTGTLTEKPVGAHSDTNHQELSQSSDQTTSDLGSVSTLGSTLRLDSVYQEDKKSLQHEPLAAAARLRLSSKKNPKCYGLGCYRKGTLQEPSHRRCRCLVSVYQLQKLEGTGTAAHLLAVA